MTQTTIQGSSSRKPQVIRDLIGHYPARMNEALIKIPDNGSAVSGMT